MTLSCVMWGMDWGEVGPAAAPWDGITPTEGSPAG